MFIYGCFQSGSGSPATCSNRSYSVSYPAFKFPSCHFSYWNRWMQKAVFLCIIFFTKMLLHTVSHLLQTKFQTSITWGLLHWRKWPGNILMLLLLPFYPFDESFCFELYVTYGCYLFRQIATAVGPCGNNRDYLFLLEKAMFDMGESFCQFSSSPSY